MVRTDTVATMTPEQFNEFRIKAIDKMMKEAEGEGRLLKARALAWCKTCKFRSMPYSLFCKHTNCLPQRDMKN